MNTLNTTSRTLVALFAAISMMLVVFAATFAATSSDHAAATWNRVSAAATWNTATSNAATWNTVTAAATWNKVSTTSTTSASTWY